MFDILNKIFDWLAEKDSIASLIAKVLPVGFFICFVTGGLENIRCGEYLALILPTIVFTIIVGILQFFSHLLIYGDNNRDDNGDNSKKGLRGYGGGFVLLGEIFFFYLTIIYFG